MGPMTTRRRTLLAGLVAAVIVIGVTIGVVASGRSHSASPPVTSSTTAPSHTGGGSHARRVLPPLDLALPGPTPVFTVGRSFSPPGTIDSGCESDVTSQLATWLYSLPQGTPGTPTIVRFASHGCYLVNGSLFLRDFRYFVFDGDGAQFRETDVSGATGKVIAGSRRPAYCGYDGWTDVTHTDFLARSDTVTIMFFMEGGCDVTFADMKFEGPNRGPGGGKAEQDTFVTFAGTQFGLVDDVAMTGPYGDYVDAQALHEVPGPQESRYEATNITVTNGAFSGAGRQGIGIILASRIAIEHDTFYSAAATMFDIEWDSTGGFQDDIDISHDVIVGMRYAFLVSAQTGATMKRFTFSDNTMSDGAEMRIFMKPAVGSSEVLISGNVATAPPLWPGRASVNVFDVAGVVVEDNTTPVGLWKRGQYSGGPFARTDGGFVSDNKLDGVTILGLKGGSLVVQQGGTGCSNSTPAGTSLDGACPGRAPVISPPVAPLAPRPLPLGA